MGEIEDRLKDMGSGKPPDKPLIKSELEKALEEEEVELVREMRMGRAEEIITKRQGRIKQLRDQLGRAGMTGDEREEEEKRKAEAELKEKTQRIEQAKALYNSCIDAGGNTKACAEMVAGLIPSATAPVAPPATSITELVTALKTLDELRGERGGELKEVLERLTTKVEALGSRPPADPIAMAQQQAQAISATYAALKDLGIIKEGVKIEGGQSLDVVQETHRHEERMEEIATNKASKIAEQKRQDKRDDMLASLPETIGRAAAKGYLESEGGGVASKGKKETYRIELEPDAVGEMDCPSCGEAIGIGPTARTAVCAKCDSRVQIARVKGKEKAKVISEEE